MSKQYIIYETNDNLIGGFRGVSSKEKCNSPEGFTPENYTEWVNENGEWIYDPLKAKHIRQTRGLTPKQIEKVENIRKQADKCLAETEEELREAEEKDRIGLIDHAHVNTVLEKRAAIRRAKDRCIKEVRNLSDSELDSYQFKMKPKDRERPKSMSKLQFLRRFTRQERIQIRQAAKEDPAIEDFHDILHLANNVHVEDPDLIEFVEHIKGEGIISKERANHILMR